MSIHDVPVRTLHGEETTLAEHKGKALLIVNVASKCGLTPQYSELESLQRNYADRGFSVLESIAPDLNKKLLAEMQR